MKRLLNRLFRRRKLFSMNAETRRAFDKMRDHPWPNCSCFNAQYKNPPDGPELQFHREPANTDSAAWHKLLDLIDRAEQDGRSDFEPFADMDREEWFQITTLPPEIGRLKKVRRLLLYGSNLTHLPPQIGDMEELRYLDLYTSYRLHWLPYEITRCTNLDDSRISTRALYGNIKHRPPFPRLRPYIPDFAPETCSVCDGAFDKYEEHRPQQVWISLTIGTDVVPLLVHACSTACIDALPTPPAGYIDRPHKGGLGQAQPKSQAQTDRERRAQIELQLAGKQDDTSPTRGNAE